MISIRLSNKIKVVSFFSIIQVVFLHANIISYSTGHSKYVQEVLTEEITRIAVPFFFLISGYLFFINADGSWAFFRNKMKRRVNSLVIPYILFSILGGLFWAVFKGDDVVSTVLSSILIVPKVFYHLWFLHDLIIMVFLSPLLYFIIKKAPYIWVIICYVWITGHYWNLFYILNSVSLFFWGLGGIVALYYPRLAEYNFRDRSGFIFMLLTLWIFLSFIVTYTGRPYYTHGILLVIGIFAVWGVYDSLFPLIENHPQILRVCEYSFCLYLFHEPILTGYKKLMFFFMEINQYTSMAIYATSPVLTIVTILTIGKFTKRNIPSIYYFITGNR